MSRVRKISKILWAIDAFEKPGPLRRHALFALQRLVERTGALVEPVHVLSAGELNMSVEFVPAGLEHYRPAAEAAIEESLRDIRFLKFETPHILMQTSSSTRGAVDLLASYAKESDADLIVIGTHARSGMARMLLGSFAETLLLHSDVPVLVVGPEPITKDAFESILVPTDLSDYARTFFEKSVALAGQLGASVTIFHSLPNFIEPMFQSGIYLLGGGRVPLHTYFSDDIEQRRRQMEAWVSWANKRGVKTDYYLDEMGGNVAHMISNYVHEKKIGLVMMAAKSNPITAAIIGSVTRQVVRSASCPVWILHPPKASNRSQEAA